MRMSEILRDLADKLATIEQGTDIQGRGIGGTPVAVEPEAEVEVDVMVPPLQQKLELLKKASGVPSHYDNAESGMDELDQVRKNAGITVVQQEAGEDNDIVG